MPEKSIHRRFTLASPSSRGADVQRFQVAANNLYKHFRIDKQIEEDGDFGKQTLVAAKELGFVMGIGRANRKFLAKGRVSKNLQALLRLSREKTRGEKIRTRARKNVRKKLRKRYASAPGEKVIVWAAKQIGTTESPAGSNWGGKITEWIKYTGYDFPVYWCGCFACYGVVKVGGAKVSNRIRLGYTGYIVEDAKAGQNGLIEVSYDNARAGDVVVYTFDHIGIVESVTAEGLLAIEGNTSSGSSGSQSNGGGVFRRLRSRSDVLLIARPTY